MHQADKVDQTLFGVGVGNCLSACVATITGIPLDAIPNFAVLYPDAGDWYIPFQRWCRGHGLAPWFVPFDGSSPTAWLSKQFPDVPWIAGGTTDRGPHCCVYVGANLFHDPNPCRTGLKEVEDGIFFLKTQYR